LLIHHYISYAKINLGLQVFNKREDGYHNLYSLFVELNLSDKLEFKPSSVFNLTAYGSAITNLPLDESNLIVKAYKLIRSKVKNISSEFSIHLKKEIPLGSGMGGGSSNAAASLRALNELWNVNMSHDELEKLAARIGADVPFFIRGGIQLIEGIGDKLTVQDAALLNGIYFLLVIPPIHISTSWAYGELNKTLQPDKSNPKFPPLSKPMNWGLFDNDFERVIRKTYPKIGHIKKTLQNAGALYAGLSGSGSTVFGAFDSLQKAEAILGYFPQYKTYLSSPVIR